MIRNHSPAVVPGLIVSDVNFNFSCFVHNHGFCFLQVWCPTVFASSGHRVLLNFGLQDTLWVCPITCSKNVQHWPFHICPCFVCFCVKFCQHLKILFTNHSCTAWMCLSANQCQSICANQTLVSENLAKLGCVFCGPSPHPNYPGLHTVVSRFKMFQGGVIKMTLRDT